MRERREKSGNYSFFVLFILPVKATFNNDTAFLNDMVLRMKEFADFLKDLREKNKMTQIQTCDGICSRREYQRYESDNAEPTLYHLRLFSNRFGYDLVAYYALLANNNGEKDIQEHIRILSELCNTGKLDEMHKRIVQLTKINIYQYYENRKILDYFDSIYWAKLGKYEISNKLCLKIINFEDPCATLENPCGYVFSEYGIYAVHIIAVNFASQGNQNKMISIYRDLCERIEQLDRDNLSNYQNTVYRRNLHQALTLNLGHAYMDILDWQNAKKTIDRAIEYAKKYSTMHMLGKILDKKVRIEMKLGNSEEADRFYEACKGICILNNDLERIEALKEDLKIE